MIKELALADLRIDGNTQQREIDDTVVLRYKALLGDGVKLPPVEVIYDGKDYFLWEGFHRIHATRKLGKTSITANVEEGTKRDAQWNSFSANAKHGFPRQPGTVKAMLLDKIFPKKVQYRLPPAKRLDVGVDVHHFKPLNYWQIKGIMADKGFVPADQHGAGKTSHY